jgi:hypothetical protein
VGLALKGGPRGSCRVTLNDALPWDIDVEGGASRMLADLGDVRLGRLDTGRGARDTTIRLPSPVGTVPVHVARGVRKLWVERPSGAAIRVHVRRGARRLALDGLQLRSTGPDTWWESAGAAEAADCLELEVGGGASELTVTVADGTVGSDRGHEGIEGADAPEAGLAEPGEDRIFELGLQILLDGLQRRLSTA